MPGVRIGLAAIAAAWAASGAAGGVHDLARLLDPADKAWRERAPERVVVRLETSRGDIRVEVNRAWAPLAADRFYNLARHGFYDDARFFRVISGRWAQFGIPAEPKVAQTWRRLMLQDEPRTQSNVRGTVAFAWAVPDGRSTQVFINLRDNSEALDAQGFAPFARVLDGMDAADALYAGYGEESGGGIRGGRQEPLFEFGNIYLIRHYPRLDYVRRAILEAAS
jgi:cyclophilin family peptidyl-prolyl cis-trans isomerase